MLRAFRPITLALLFPLAAVSLSGCKGEVQVDVKGKVTYNGKPLEKPGGQIVFVGPTGNKAMAPIALDGTYQASKVSAGSNRVIVYYTNPASPAGGAKPPRRKQGDPPPPPPPPPFLTPENYAAVDTTDLTVQVEKGTVYNPNLLGPKIR